MVGSQRGHPPEVQKGRGNEPYTLTYMTTGRYTQEWGYLEGEKQWHQGWWPEHLRQAVSQLRRGAMSLGETMRAVDKGHLEEQPVLD